MTPKKDYDTHMALYDHIDRLLGRVAAIEQQVAELRDAVFAMQCPTTKTLPESQRDWTEHNPRPAEPEPPALERCRVCNGQAEFVTGRTYCQCSSPVCHFRGPNNDPYGHKWDGVNRKLRFVEAVATMESSAFAKSIGLNDYVDFKGPGVERMWLEYHAYVARHLMEEEAKP